MTVEIVDTEKPSPRFGSENVDQMVLRKKFKE
jgi:hypothetical protein